jgi:glutamate synthase domain-containing protein 3
MTGGQAFLWDPEVERVLTRVNPDLVAVLRSEHDDQAELRWLVERHADLTGSERARELLADWEASTEHLWHVVPRTRAETLVATAARRVATA